MIVIESVFYKNFLAVGNAGVNIDIAGHNRTLVIGTNGSGKTTLIEALCYCLFGKSFRDVNLAQLINSINGKQTEVEVCFSVGADKYRVRRGLKPALFEIYENETLRPFDSARDYQAYLEEQILQINYNSFKQIVVLGSSDYEPFMRLPAGDRRKIVENLLDLQVFSTMNALLKDKVREQTAVGEDISRKLYENQLHLTKNDEKKLFVLKQLQEAKSQEATRHSELTLKRSNYDTKLVDVEKTLETLSSKLTPQPKLQKLQREISADLLEAQRNVRKLCTHREFYTQNDTCPTCTQPIDANFKAEIVRKADEEEQGYQQAITEATGKLGQVETALEKLNDILEKHQKAQQVKAQLKAAIAAIDEQLNEKPITVDESVLDDITAERATLEKQLAHLKAQEAEHLKMQEIIRLSALLLKDTGIKAKIISKFIPIINKTLNEFLDQMNFYCQFEIDENFNETIKSRYRDTFSYNSFSDGQKLRIDLALLFTWREVAKLKNSMDINILIMDETFDKSLDDDGISDLMKILYNLKYTNTIVISPKPEPLLDKFDRVLAFELKNNFTVMKEVE